MTIVSEITSHQSSWTIWLLVTIAALILLGVCVWVAAETCSDVAEFISYVLAVAFTVCLVVTLAVGLSEKQTQYRVRLDNDTSVDDLREKYDIIEYDVKHDTWTVKDKKGDETK